MLSVRSSKFETSQNVIVNSPEDSILFYRAGWICKIMTPFKPFQTLCLLGYDTM